MSVRLSIRSSDILLVRFVRRLIGWKGEREVNSLSLTHTHSNQEVSFHSLTHSTWLGTRNL